MTPTEIALVQQGFDQIEPVAERVGLALYEQLFALDPSLRQLFKGDITRQAGLIMAEVGVVVRSLDDLGPVLSRIEALGRRHASYGVESRYFSVAGPVLLDALQAELGPAFTEEARSAWATAYTTLTDAMITAMTESAP
jgi:hemoglobin-like flavoprotein